MARRRNGHKTKPRSKANELFNVTRMRIGSCTKVAYENRTDAKKSARFLKPAFGAMRPYRCETCGFWHIGHLPGAVVRGSAVMP